MFYLVIPCFKRRKRQKNQKDTEGNCNKKGVNCNKKGVNCNKKGVISTGKPQVMRRIYTTHSGDHLLQAWAASTKLLAQGQNLHFGEEIRMAQHCVTKSNALIEASYKLTLQEQRLVLCCIAQLDPRKPVPDRDIIVSADEFAATFDLSVDKAYEHLREAASQLFQRELRTHDGKVRERFRWVEKCKYHDGEGYVGLRFTKTIAPYLTMLRKHFTSYQLQAISGMRSPYAIRLYELLSQYRSVGKRELSIDVFRDRLELGGKYDRFSSVKARVLEPAAREVNAKSDIVMGWRAKRRANKVIALVFTVVERSRSSARETELEATGATA